MEKMIQVMIAYVDGILDLKFEKINFYLIGGKK